MDVIDMILNKKPVDSWMNTTEVTPKTGHQKAQPKRRPTPQSKEWILQQIQEGTVGQANHRLWQWLPPNQRKEVTDDLIRHLCQAESDQVMFALVQIRRAKIFLG